MFLGRKKEKPAFVSARDASASDAIHNALLDNLPCAALILKKNTREIVALNKVAAQMGAAIGKTCFETCGQRGDPCPWCLAPVVWKKNEPQRTEVEYNGVFYEGIWVPFSDDLYVHYIFDITRRKELEEQLKKERDYSESVFGAVQMIMLQLDAEGRIVRFNPYMEQLSGYRLQEVQGKDWFTTFLPKCDYDKIRDVFKTALNGPSTSGNVNAIVCKDGSLKQIEWYDTKVKDAAGASMGLLAFGKDVTEQKKAEQAIKDLARFPEDNKHPVYRVSKDGILLYANPASRRLVNGEQIEVGDKLPEKRAKFIAEVYASEKMRGKEARLGEKIFLFHYVPVASEGYVNVYGVDITELKKSEEEIRTAKNFLDTVVDMSLFPMWISDDKGILIRTNRALCEAMHMSAEEIIGKYNVFNDENLKKQGVMPLVNSVFEKHACARFAIPWKSGQAGSENFSGGPDIFIEVGMFPILNSQGALTNVVCQWVDISKQKNAEKDLRENEEKYRGIVDNIGIGVALIGPEMEILSLNAQMKKWNPHIDLRDKHICYRSFNKPPKEEACPWCPTVQTLKDGLVHEGITETPMDGKIFNYRIVSSPIRDESGKVVAAVEMVEDITERKYTQEQLESSEKKFRAIFDNTTDGILLTDYETKKFKDANQSICRMLGYSLEELKERGVADIHPKEELVTIFHEIERQYADPNAPAADIPVLRKDGSIFYASVLGTRMNLSGREYMVAVFRDVTERKAFEEHQEKTLKDLQMFKEVTVDRENKMIGLKKEVNKLCQELGKKAPYDLSFLQ